METKQELILKNLLIQEQEKSRQLEKENQDLKEVISMLKSQAEDNDVDMVAAMQVFKETLKEAQQGLEEIKELKRKMEMEKAAYIRRMEQAVIEIVGDDPLNY